MAASPSQKQINAHLRRLQKENPGVEYQVLRASNGEVAIMPKAHVDYFERTPTAQLKASEAHFPNCSCKWCCERLGPWPREVQS